MEVIKTVSNRPLTELKREIILIRLSSGQSVSSIAKELNLSANHIRDYLRTDAGVERLESSLRDAREVLERRLPTLVEKALTTIGSVLDAPYMSAEKMAAAKTVIHTMVKLSSSRRCPSCEDKRIVN